MNTIYCFWTGTNIMDEKRRQEVERADRIAYLIGIQYDSLTVLYETICDKEYEEAQKEIKVLMTELRLIFKSIEYDDF
jgi:hypothetical protein